MDDTARQSVIDMRNVTLEFRPNVGVFDVSIQVEPGTIFGLIGPSGSGKTTTVRLALGLYKAQHGHIRVLGEDPRRFHARTRERIGYMPQRFVLYPNLTVRENLSFVSSLYGMRPLFRGPRLRQVLEFVELADHRRVMTSKLSGGMQRRLALASALVHNPIVLFADEPTAGVDPVLRAKFWDYFRVLRDENHTLLVTTQYVGEAAFCDYVGVMRNGRLIHVDTPEMLRKTAMGGEIINIVVEPDQVLPATYALVHHPLVRNIYHRPDHGKPGLLQVYVEEASDALPVLFNYLRDDHPEITVRTAEEYLPPFDEIFINLMEQAEAQNV